MIPVIFKCATVEDFRRNALGRTLNLGGVGMPEATNYDLDPRADVIGDAHDLHAIPDASYDVVICQALLQLCTDPAKVIAEAKRVLVPGGLLYLDVPWIQPACEHESIKDLWRFSAHGVRHLLRDFTVLEVGTAIPATSALAFYLARIRYARNRYVNAAIELAVTLAVLPVALTKLGRQPETAGAIYAVARK